MKRLHYLLLCILAGYSFPLFSQPTQTPDQPGICSISGKVIDKETGNPVEYATVAVCRLKDSSIVGGAVSDIKGLFHIEQLSFGQFFLKISFIGFETTVVNGIRLNPQNTTNDVGSVQLSVKALVLNDIEVRDKAPMVQYQLDKKIINVDQNIIAVGGTAIDLLKNVPSVNVDIDGNLSMRGSSNLTILIDGKPSVISGGTSILEQIPASSIESIELITNPSAKYDPDGMSGIINIITKKNKKDGLNGLISLNLGNDNRYNASISLNYKIKKVNFYFSYNYRNDQHGGYGNSIRTTTIRDSFTTLKQDGGRGVQRINNGLKLGFDYEIAKNAVITYSVNLRTNVSDETDTADNKLYDELDNLFQFYKIDGTEVEDNQSVDNAIDFKKQFYKKGHELSANLNFSINDNDESNEQEYLYLDPADLTKQLFSTLKRDTNFMYNTLFSFQTDYSYPLKKDSKLELGFKAINRNVDQDNHYNNYIDSLSAWKYDELKSNRFVLNEQILSLYGVYSNVYKKFNYQFGLRIEQAYINSEQLTTDTLYKNDYLNFFPSFSVSKDLKNKQQVQFSYSRRVNRPGVESLNPFIDYHDPQNIRYGNPYLLPEFTGSYEFAYSKYGKKYFVAPTLFYRQTNNMMTWYKTLDTVLGITQTTYMNTNKSTSMGFELIYNYELKKWWKITSNFSAYKFIIDAANLEQTLGSNESYSWTARFTSNTYFSKTLSMQLSGNYRSPVNTAQGKRFEMYSLDFGARKDVFKNKAYITFRLSDVFNTQRFRFESEGVGFTSYNNRKRTSRIAFIGFNYKINGGVKTKERKKSDEFSPSDDMFE